MKDARYEQFRAFEDAAFLIMARHGAKVVSVIQTHEATDGGPHETHVLEFPNNAAFDAYRTDPELVSMAALREACIAKTDIEYS